MPRNVRNSMKAIVGGDSQILPSHLTSDHAEPHFKQQELPITCNNAIYKCDKYGNNVLHLCVIHGLNDMYSHVRKTAIRQIRREIIASLNKYDKLSEERRRKYNSILDLQGAFGGRLEDLTCYPPNQSKIWIPPVEMRTETWFEVQARIKFRERMLNVLNAECHSPLTLAADFTHFGDFTDEFETVKIATLNVLLEDELLFKYDFGPVHATSIEIEGFDRPYNQNNYVKRPLPSNVTLFGAIEWMCISDAEKGMQLPVVKDLIMKKWKSLGVPVFNKRFNVHIIFTFFMTAIAFYPFKFPFVSRTSTPNTNRFITTAYIVNAVFVLYYIYEDAQYLKSLGTNFWYFFSGTRGAAILDRLLRTIMEVSFVAHATCKLLLLKQFDFDEPASDAMLQIGLMRTAMIFLSLAVGVSWFYWFYFFLGFDSVAPFLLIVYRVMAIDVYYFMKFYSIVAISFGVALSVVSNDGTPGPWYGIYRCFLAMWVLLQDTVGINGIELTVIDIDSSYTGLKWLNDFYVTFFYVMVVLLMLNLLIGMIGTTYTMYFQSKTGLVLMEQYNILCAMERTSGSKGRDEMLEKYTTSSNPSIEIPGGMEVSNIQHSHSFEYRRMEPGWMENSKGKGSKSTMSALLIMDPQVDFMAAGSFPMAGSDEKYKLISKFIESNIELISGIFVTMQSHHAYDITDSSFWQSGNSRRQAIRNTGSLSHHGPHRHKSLHRTKFENVSKSLLSSLVPRDPLSHSMESKSSDLESSPDATSPQSPDSVRRFGGWAGRIAECVEHEEDDESPVNLEHSSSGHMFLEHVDDEGQELSMDSSTKLLSAPSSIMPNAHTVTISPTIRKYIRKLQRRKEIEKGQNPDPFTIIKAADIFTGDWVPVDPADKAWCEHYLLKLEAKGKPPLTILPSHCIIESPGHTVSLDINRACRKWEYYRSKTTMYIMKGYNYRTEMFSALQAEVEDPDDPSTAMNENLLNMLRMYEKVLICGNTLSRSIRATILDLARNNISMSKLVILEDACTAIEGLETETQRFLDDMRKKGVTVTTVQDAARYILN